MSNYFKKLFSSPPKPSTDTASSPKSPNSNSGKSPIYSAKRFSNDFSEEDDKSFDDKLFNLLQIDCNFW